MRLSEDRVRGYKHFANKLWNISRFVLENVEPSDNQQGDALLKLTPQDKALINEASELAKQVSEHIEKFRLDLAADATYHFVWDRFAAEMLEQSKEIFKGQNQEARASRARALYEILIISLKLLHPFMPFVTEAIWQELPQKENDILMVAKWPVIS